ncbi:alpha-ketoglutarate-dependent dioxygenase AlkB [Lentilitoribacter sp. EG35]|uniref:alpha-ketoglutarate-dependent dioxygenase AlkB n=1 Tax=Lentilitoribacter sp. EG35 TaxID=3234192 RepID=UPI003460A66B
MQVLPKGFSHIPNHLNISTQRELVDVIREIVKQAPLYRPEMPKTGKPFSVRMTNCGELGWVSDEQSGYRYQPNHPKTSKPWPKIPDQLMQIWRELSGVEYSPEACLINFYDTSARMGLHQDNDENNLEAPVLSISLGDTCQFRIGQTTRGGQTKSFKLHSGDVVVLGGESRLCFHGVDKIYPDTSPLLKNGGRINLTLRRVTQT